MQWHYFPRDTVGKQFARAVDSVSANIAEGSDRYNKKDKVRFYRIAQGSVKESADWARKAITRGLLTEKEYYKIQEVLDNLPRDINQLIKSTNTKLAH